MSDGRAPFPANPTLQNLAMAASSVAAAQAAARFIPDMVEDELKSLG